MIVRTLNSQYEIHNGRIWKLNGSENIWLNGECFRHVTDLSVGNSMILDVHGFESKVITSPVVSIRD